MRDHAERKDGSVSVPLDVLEGLIDLARKGGLPAETADALLSEYRTIPRGSEAQR